MIPESVESTVFQTEVEAHESVATWLVGARGPLGGVGGESEEFENDVVMFVSEELIKRAQGKTTPMEEGNFFRGASVAQTDAMATFASQTRGGLSALGNAAGRTGDNYDQADREVVRLLAEAETALEGLGTSPEGTGEPPTMWRV